jgi:hypothetical protein
MPKVNTCQKWRKIAQFGHPDARHLFKAWFNETGHGDELFLTIGEQLIKKSF